MRVAHLSLGDFRNYRTAELSLERGPNLLLGRNGQGKTNLVEAISYFGMLRSHRVSSDSALIRFEQPSATMRMRVSSGDREVVLEFLLARSGPNKAQVNGNPVRSRELTRWFASVVFAPEDLAIVRGDPSTRRRFLDDALTTRLPVAGGVLSDYERVVRQRTALLKSARHSSARKNIDATLSIWDDQLIELGTRIMLARRELVEDLSEPLSEAYSKLVGANHQAIMGMVETVSPETVSRETVTDATAVVSRETLEAEFREALLNVRAKELERGATLIGPHRDDLLFGLNGLPVRGFASHGESWSFSLSLKLALASILRTDSSAGDPVIVLDDVFAELDQGRRERLMSLVADYEQVIVTAAVETDVPVGVDWHVVDIDAGTLQVRAPLA